MKKLEIAYIPIGVPTFDLVSAKKEFEASIDVLKEYTDNLVYPDEMLLTLDLLDQFLDKINPDAIVLQNITFANAQYTSNILNKFNCPILLWTLREPVIDGGRLRLNSLTGAYSAANTISYFTDRKFEYIFGAPNETQVRNSLSSFIKANELVHEMKGMKLASIGNTPEGFGFGRALDSEMMKVFGVKLESVEARELINIAKEYSEDEVGEYLDKASTSIKNLESIDKKNVTDFSKLFKAYENYVKKNNIKAIASRCWPDFFTSFGTPVCAVLAMLNDMGIAASCEADTYGALSMYMGMKLSGKAVFFGDPVSLNEEENTITYWHCGTAACSLARKDTGAQVGVHCNRKIGPTLEFGCESFDNATIFRIGKKTDGSFRFFIEKGAAIDKPKQFLGTSIVVRTNKSAEKIVYNSIKDGFEPHFVVINGDVSEELKMIAHILKIEVVEY